MNDKQIDKCFKDVPLMTTVPIPHQCVRRTLDVDVMMTQTVMLENNAIQTSTSVRRYPMSVKLLQRMLTVMEMLLDNVSQA